MIAVKPNADNQPSVTLTLESMGVLLGILVSVSMLLTGVVQVITKFNSIDEKIRDLKEANTANDKAINEVKSVSLQLIQIDKKLDLHLQNYESRNDMLALIIGQMKEVDEHNRERWKEEIAKTNAEVKQLENYLQQSTSFRVRE